MSAFAILYPSTEYILRAVGLDKESGLIIALCFFLLVVILAFTVGTLRLNRKGTNR
jgi:hypothetical protein